MAILDSFEVSEQQSGSFKDGTRTYTRVFCVVTDNTTDNVASVVTASAIPARYTAYPGDSYAFVDAYDVQMSQDNIKWIVRVTYSNQADSESPLDRDPVFSWSSTSEERPVDADIDGNPVVNSAGIPFDPSVTEKVYFPRVTIQRNEADEPDVTEYVNKVNSATFYDYDAGYCLCEDMTANEKTEDDLTYWDVNYSFLFSDLPEGFQRKIMDRGMIQKSGTPCSMNMMPVSEPVPLDGAGNQLASGGTPVYLSFTTKESADFGALGFPGS